MHISDFSKETFSLEAFCLQNKDLIIFETFKVVIKSTIFVNIVVLYT